MIRRAVAFAEAVYDGTVTVEGSRPAGRPMPLRRNKSSGW